MQSGSALEEQGRVPLGSLAYCSDGKHYSKMRRSDYCGMHGKCGGIRLPMPRGRMKALYVVMQDKRTKVVRLYKRSMPKMNTSLRS